MGSKKEIINYKYKRWGVLAIIIVLVFLIYLFKDSSFALRSISAMGLISLFYAIDHYFDIKFSSIHYFLIIIIAIFSLLFSPLYYIYPNYDKLQHFVQPIFISAMVFYTVQKLKLDMKWKLTFTFFITLGILGLFEIGEYTLDYFFDLKLQGVYLRDLKGIEKFHLILDKNDDTMIDLFLGTLGSALYVIVSAISFNISKRK